VAVRARSEPGDAGGDPHLERLLGCEETLAVIASDVDGLLDQLAQMRGRAESLEERCAEQDDLLHEREGHIARLEDEHVRATRQVEELGAALADAVSSVTDLEARATSFHGERERLRKSLEERSRRLAAAERELAAMKETMRGRGLPAFGVRSRPTLGYAANDGHPLPKTVTTHLRFVALPDGYRLTTSDERCARPGDRVVIDDHSFLVTKVGRSPLPDDPRPCVFLLPDAHSH
jgi:hypothetical protein